jgi:hypothetical protein
MSRPQRTWATSSTRPLQSSSRPLHTSGLAAQAQDMFSSTRPSQSSSAQSSAVGASQPGAAPQDSARGAPGPSGVAGQIPTAVAEQTSPLPSPLQPRRPCRLQRPTPTVQLSPLARNVSSTSPSQVLSWQSQRSVGMLPATMSPRRAVSSAWLLASSADPVPPAAASAFSCGSSTVKPTT